MLENLKRRKATNVDLCTSCEGLGEHEGQLCSDCLGQGVRLTLEEYRMILRIGGIRASDLDDYEEPIDL
jgi:hypothetical protein